VAVWQPLVPAFSAHWWHFGGPLKEFRNGPALLSHPHEPPVDQPPNTPPRSQDTVLSQIWRTVELFAAGGRSDPSSITQKAGTNPGLHPRFLVPVQHRSKLVFLLHVSFMNHYEVNCFKDALSMCSMHLIIFRRTYPQISAYKIRQIQIRSTLFSFSILVSI
jgi:hypothetical protein